MKLFSGRSYEVKPGLDAIRYLLSYGFVTWLAQRATRRKQRMFVEIGSNIDRHILTEGLFEKGVLEILEQVCRATGRTAQMIDVGANIGNHTVALAPIFKKVDAVEPHPVLFRILEANSIRNNLGHVTCHNFGLAGHDSTATLAESISNHSICRIKEHSKLSPSVFGLSEEAFGEQFSVQLRSAAEFVGGFRDVLDTTFIKIDVEGMEEEILVSLMPLLKAHKPVVGFEWFTRGQPQLTSLVLGIEGYDLYAIRVHDAGKSMVWRAVKILFFGRTYTLERIDPRKLDDVYPLGLLVPKVS